MCLLAFECNQLDLLVCTLPEVLLSIHQTDSTLFFFKYEAAFLPVISVILSTSDVLMSTCCQKTFWGGSCNISNELQVKVRPTFTLRRDNILRLCLVNNLWIKMSKTGLCWKKPQRQSDKHTFKQMQLLIISSLLFKLTVFLFCPYCLLLCLWRQLIAGFSCSSHQLNASLLDLFGTCWLGWSTLNNCQVSVWPGN